MSAANKTISVLIQICILPATVHWKMTGQLQDNRPCWWCFEREWPPNRYRRSENAINMHAGVVESAVVGYPHDIKGQGIYAFIIYRVPWRWITHQEDISLQLHVIIGAIAKPDKIQFASGLPKARSGKIMRRIPMLMWNTNLAILPHRLDPGGGWNQNNRIW